jgi:hypothetical protein
MGIDQERWTGIFLKVSEAIANKIPDEELEHYTGYGKEVYKMKEEIEALKRVFDIFLNEIEEAVDRQKPDDKTFLKYINVKWGTKVTELHDYFYQAQLHHRPSEKCTEKRIQTIKNSLSTGKFVRANSGSFYSRDLRIFLCHMAFAIYQQLFEFPASSRYPRASPWHFLKIKLRLP